jgi:hypothetical protein
MEAILKIWVIYMSGNFRKITVHTLGAQTWNVRFSQPALPVSHISFSFRIQESIVLYQATITFIFKVTWSRPVIYENSCALSLHQFFSCLCLMLLHYKLLFIFLSVLYIFMIMSVTIQDSSLVGRYVDSDGLQFALTENITYWMSTYNALRRYMNGILAWLGLLACSADSSKRIPRYNFKVSNSRITLHHRLVGTNTSSCFDATVQSDIVSRSLQSAGNKTILSSAVTVCILSPLTFHSSRQQWTKPFLRKT